MLKKIVLCLIIQLVTSQDTEVPTDSTVSTETIPTTTSLPKEQCTEPGFHCSDCNTIGFCVKNSNGSFSEVTQSCVPDKFCNDKEQACSDKQSACNKKPFVCTEPNVLFPDAFDCQKYHLCDDRNQANEVKCPQGKAYDACTGVCNLPLTVTECKQGPVPECTKIGQSGALPQNTNIYYICLADDQQILYPQLYRCADFKGFKDFQCGPISAKCSRPTRIAGNKYVPVHLS